MTSVAKPSLEEVLKYGRKATASFLRSYAAKLPMEQREDIHQEAAVRLIRAYEQMDPARGIKAFCQIHCMGAVLDYIRGGSGFEEAGGSKPKPRLPDPVPIPGFEPAEGEPKPEIVPFEDSYPDRLKYRTEVRNDEGAALDVEEVAGIFGVFAGSDDPVLKPNWPLLSRLAGRDRDVHLVCKILLGFDQEEIAAQFEKGITRERLSQRLYELFERLDSPLGFGHVEIEQIIFAFGLCDYFHMPNRDNGFGWDFEPFDLLDPQSFEKALVHYQPALDGVRAGKLKRSDIYGKYKVSPKSNGNGNGHDESEGDQTEFDLDLM